MANLNYYYISERTKNDQGVVIQTPIPDIPKGISPFNSSENLFFNIDKNFIDGLQKATNVELGQMVPHISLASLNADGSVNKNLTLDFFQKTSNYSKLPSERYGERPNASLKSVEIKTDNASGYIYYTNIRIDLKIHRPDQLMDASIYSLMFPSQPFQLEYGWNGPNSFFNKKRKFRFNVKTYTISIDNQGEVDLSVEGTAFNEQMTNFYIGDFGPIGSILDKNKAVYTELSSSNLLGASQSKLYDMTEYLTDSKQNTNVTDYKIMKLKAETLSSVKKLARSELKKNVDSLMRELSKKVQGAKSNPYKFKSGYLIVHDIVDILCKKTLQLSVGTLIPAGKDNSEVRFIYGNFNDTVKGDFTNLAQFPIDWEDFSNKISEQNEKEGPFTFQWLFNTLIGEYINNSSYWDNFKCRNEDFFMPTVVHRAINTIEGNNKNLLVDVYLVDITRDLPITTVDLMPKDRSSQIDMLKSLKSKKPNFPIIKSGHANSFIKSISLTQMMDEYMRSVFIEKMYRSSHISPERSSTTNDAGLETIAQKPFVLPLRGEMELLGHIEWEPYKAFFLSTGIPLIDGVYKILSVTHKLSSEGFSTGISFIYN